MPRAGISSTSKFLSPQKFLASRSSLFFLVEKHTPDFLVPTEMKQFISSLGTKRKPLAGNSSFWCPGRDSNPHAVLSAEDFKSSMSTIPSPGQGFVGCILAQPYAFFLFTTKWSAVANVPPNVSIRISFCASQMSPCEPSTLAPAVGSPEIAYCHSKSS